jgi:hypothetical protein
MISREQIRPKLVLYPVLNLLARLHRPRTAARLLAMSLMPLPGHRARRGTGRPQYRILVLNFNKPGFVEDIEESLLPDDTLEVLCWPIYALKAFAAALLAPQLDNHRYASDDPAIEASKQEYRRFLLEMWQHFREIQPIDAVVSANFGYFAQREFGAALKEAGTPLIVLHKENVKSPGRVEYWDAIYRTRGQFEGSKILVYSATERDLQARTGVAAHGQIEVTGMPRLDRIHRWRRDQANAGGDDGRPQVLFFSFWRKEKLTGTGTWEDLSWTGLCDGTHRAVVELARQAPHARIVIKTKAVSQRVDEIWDILREPGRDLPTNLTVISGGDPFPLIAGSRVVIGFNTTALLEALAAGKPVIVPQFAEVEHESMRRLVIDVGSAVERASSPQELVRMTSAHLNAFSATPKELSDAALKALTYWVGNDDGHAGQRVLEAVRAEMARCSRRQVFRIGC